MIKFPEDLLYICKQYWPPVDAPKSAESLSVDPLDITIVTAFFDLGRASWTVQGNRPSPWQRPNSVYIERFGNLARIKNQIVIFTSPEFAEEVLDKRRQAGREDATVIFVIDTLFEDTVISSIEHEIKSKMTDDFRATTRAPLSPEYNIPRYVLLNSLKSLFVLSALRAKVVTASQVSWLDFGYCRDDTCFNPEKRWRFDTQGKMIMFHMRPLDSLPIFKVVQRGNVYFQGGCLIGPIDLWPSFVTEIDFSFASLLRSDLVDDDQTLLLMAYRRMPEKFRVFPVERRDWFVAFRLFNENAAGEKVKFTDHRLLEWLHSSIAGRLLKFIAVKLIRRFDYFT